jgi:uncharacterized MAPEG superfamily protein
MTTELTVLAWGCVLALLHVFVAAQAKTRQYGTAWNLGSRDEELPPPNPIAGRLARAQANFYETFPIMIAAIAIVSIAGLANKWTGIGAIVWLVARTLYLPLYAFGVRYLRSLAWAAGLAGIVMVLWPALAAAF